ncbi:MAG: DUF2240 family protein [Candidatus Heimdallarchaeaceae archaeon]|jgi:replication factor A1
MSNQRSLKEIIETISIEAGIGKEEIHQLINKKMDELGEFVTELGAAHIVAREMGVDLSSEPPVKEQSVIKIDQLVPDLNNVSLLGRIVRLYDSHSFKRKDGTDGVLQSIIIEDKTGSIRIVFWDEKAGELQNSNCKTGDPIRIFNGYTRLGRDGSTEVHLGTRSQLQIRPSGIKDDELPDSKPTHTKIQDIKGNEIDVSIRGKITQIDDKLEFERSDGTKGQKQGLVIGDETGEIYINFWNEKAEKLDAFVLDDIVEIVGLATKIGLRGFVELHSNRYSSISKITGIKDIVVKKGFIGSMKGVEDQLLKINQISELNKLVSIRGLIADVSSLHEFSRENGSKGKVRNLTITDSSGIIRIVLWDDKTQLVNEEDIDKLFTIYNGFTRKGRFEEIEIHCGKQTQIDIEEGELDQLKQYIVGFSNINNLSEEETEVNIKGIITELGTIQEIETKEKEMVKMLNFKIEDNTADIRITCWRENVAKLQDISVGDTIEILHARIKADTGYGIGLLIARNTIIKKALDNSSNPQGFVSSLNVSDASTYQQSIQDIEDINEGDDVTIQATVVKLVEKPFVYELCPMCKKKVKDENNQYLCAEHGAVEEPINRILFTFVVNDGTGNINIFCAGKLAEIILGLSADSASRMVEEQESSKAPYTHLKNKGFVNSELLISGKVNKNPFLNSLEIVAKSIEKVRYNDATKGLVKHIYVD